MKNAKVSIEGQVPLKDFVTSLESVLEGLKTGAFDMEGVRFAPHGDVQFKIKGKRKKDFESLKIELSWDVSGVEAVPAIRANAVPARREEPGLPANKGETAVQVINAATLAIAEPWVLSGSDADDGGALGKDAREVQTDTREQDSAEGEGGSAIPMGEGQGKSQTRSKDKNQGKGQGKDKNRDKK